MFCEKCGTQNPEKAAFCKKCGAQLEIVQKTSVKPVPNSTKTDSPQRRRTSGKQLIQTTKQTSRAYLIPNLVVDFLFFGIAGYFFARSSDLYASYWYRSEGETLQKVGILVFLLAFLSALYHVMVARTYADVFADRIAGSGMQGISCKSFNLRFDQVTGISASKGILNLESGSGVFLVINTSAGNYKVITTDARAKEIIKYYSRIENP